MSLQNIFCSTLYTTDPGTSVVPTPSVFEICNFEANGRGLKNWVLSSTLDNEAIALVVLEEIDREEISKSFGGIFSLIAFILRPNMRTHGRAPAEDFWNNFMWEKNRATYLLFLLYSTGVTFC